jgi:hypothetical protein
MEIIFYMYNLEMAMVLMMSTLGDRSTIRISMISFGPNVQATPQVIIYLEAGAGTAHICIAPMLVHGVTPQQD